MPPASASVRVPATSANLGPGFDCLGLALDIWATVTLARDIPENDRPLDRMALNAARALFAAAELEPPTGYGAACEGEIPLARGLGASAAATVGGLLAGNSLVGDPLGPLDILRLAADIEGHADNAAAALYGGFTVTGPTDAGWEAIRFDAPRELRAVAFIPELRLATTEMRRVLPSAVPLADAVENLGRVGIGVAGLATGRYDLLRTLTVDRLHEPYRAAVFPELPLLVGAAREAGAIGACLAGAGSTVIAFIDSVSAITRIEAAFLAVAGDRELAGRVEVLTPRNKGAVVVKRGS